MNECDKTTKAALVWITDILKKLDIPFQIAGGLAAIAYGSTRPLVDIDIDIPEDAFPLVKNEVSQYIIFGPAQYQDEAWELLLMTLKFKNQLIDLSGAHHAKMRNKETEQWQNISTDFSKVKMKKIYGLVLPVIDYDVLLAYKKAIGRDVDLIDIQEMSSQSNIKM